MPSSQKLMTNEEAERKIAEMLEFIEDDGNKRTLEVDRSADEEVEILREKTLREGKVPVNRLYEKKFSNVRRYTRIHRSQVDNQARLLFNASSYHCINAIRTEAKKIVSQLSKNERSYSLTLHNILLQSLCKMLEKKVILMVRRQDVRAVESILEQTAKDFYDLSQIKVKFHIDKENFLLDESCGGIFLFNATRTISIDSTMSYRTDRIWDYILPQIKPIIFGPGFKVFKTLRLSTSSYWSGLTLPPEEPETGKRSTSTSISGLNIPQMQSSVKETADKETAYDEAELGQTILEPEASTSSNRAPPDRESTTSETKAKAIKFATFDTTELEERLDTSSYNGARRYNGGSKSNTTSDKGSDSGCSMSNTTSDIESEPLRDSGGPSISNTIIDKGNYDRQDCAGPSIPNTPSTEPNTKTSEIESSESD